MITFIWASSHYGRDINLSITQSPEMFATKPHKTPPTHPTSIQRIRILPLPPPPRPFHLLPLPCAYRGCWPIITITDLPVTPWFLFYFCLIWKNRVQSFFDRHEDLYPGVLIGSFCSPCPDDAQEMDTRLLLYSTPPVHYPRVDLTWPPGPGC